MKILSGGQTGADRAALDVALELGLPLGGTVPRGRAAEDGPIPPRYPLRETPDEDPATRTACNVRDADATVVLSHGPLSGGSALTLRLARELRRPVLHLDLDQLDEAAAARELRHWLSEQAPAVLNVAGPRASEDPRIYEATRRILTASLLRRTGVSPP